MHEMGETVKLGGWFVGWPLTAGLCPLKQRDAGDGPPSAARVGFQRNKRDRHGEAARRVQSVAAQSGQGEAGPCAAHDSELEAGKLVGRLWAQCSREELSIVETAC
jgi:hypothetical protein